ncbi:FeoB-associated Cys-rich membrane protein [Desulfovibrio sp. OttesenSCG-928-I05]|nr:FeoB-associated Cys-rich membrane protein [Desulfovibrio sp. OttesenSCG-928-I05]
MGEYILVGGIIALALGFTVRHFLSIRKGGGCGHCNCSGCGGASLKDKRPECCGR